MITLAVTAKPVSQQPRYESLTHNLEGAHESSHLGTPYRYLVQVTHQSRPFLLLSQSFFAGAQSNKMPPPPTDLKTWSRQAGEDQYLCTTDPTPIDLAALSAALSSDMMWWAKPVEEGELKKMVDHSLCLSLYFARTDGDRKEGSMSLFS
jgi:hypothetical protein